MSDCKERILPACDKVIAEGIDGNCPSWSVCLPFGGNLRTEGGCIHYDAPQSVPEDGEYSRIVIANGCIVDAKKAEIPLYTSTPCAPVPAPCDCGGGSESLPDPSPQAGNLFRYDLQGRPLVRLTVGTGDGISVTGTGTANDPLVITNTREEQDTNHIRSGSSVITITGTGSVSDPLTISHAEGKQGKYLGLTFDEFGHLIDYEKEAAKGITGIVGTDGIHSETDTNSGVAVISLADPASPKPGTYTLGGYDVVLTGKNLISSIDQVIDVQEGTYAIGQYDISVTETGSIDDIQDTFNTGTDYTKYFADEETSVRYGTFILRASSYLRITYSAVIPAAQKEKLGMSLNGRRLAIGYESYAAGAVGGTLIATIEAQTQGVMSAGTHTVELKLSGELTFTNNPAKLTVVPTWPFED